MRSHRSGPIAAVRFLLYVQQAFAGDDQLPGFHWPDGHKYLWVCRFPGCRWARFLPLRPSRSRANRCSRHGSDYRYRADDTDRDMDVKCPMLECVVTTYIEQYDSSLHTPEHFCCPDGRHKEKR
ncbi:hypothetical protein [Streptomyces sp. NPDC001137]|uniref:hypothetical protein n=1 Tax=Streptomyces sp. NPDC001137 TaxID=3154378 RepID=UPI00332063E8